MYIYIYIFLASFVRKKGKSRGRRKKKDKEIKKEKENKQRMIKNAGETKYFISSSAHGRENRRSDSKDHPWIITKMQCLS